MTHPLYALKCSHCGQTLQRMMLLAMLQDAGASAGLDADLCPERSDGGQHDFAKPTALDDTHPEGGDAKQAPCGASQSGPGTGQRPTPNTSSEEGK